MKISKVDHVKSGIDQKLSRQRGMLYKQPQKKYEGKQLEEHVRNLSRKAKALYQVFPVSGNPKTEKELYKKYFASFRFWKDFRRYCWIYQYLFYG